MFKGLRTKIESEQKGHSSLQEKAFAPIAAVATKSIESKDFNRSPKIDQDNRGTTALVAVVDISTPITKPTTTDRVETSSLPPSEAEPQQKRDTESDERLHGKISELESRLETVIRERDESNEQNSQLYQLIEKLRRNLDSEKKANSSLKQKLTDLSHEDINNPSSLPDAPRPHVIKNISIKPNSISAIDQLTLADSDFLKLKVDELQNSLSEKNRQLRITQQNLNDIRKALQREVTEHRSTTEELNRTKELLSQLHVNNEPHESVVAVSNGSSGDLVVPKDQSENKMVLSSNVTPDEGNCNEFVIGPPQTQMDGVSRSSTSDFDHDDLRNCISSKDINHEYLKNVLFRYMTSVDSETSQHLVKALSVIMNFSPEQSAAIKSAMQARSSWLRLK